MITELAPLLDLSEAFLAGIVLVFCRIAGIVTLLPGFGEQSVPLRVRLVIALAFTALVWPLVVPEGSVGQMPLAALVVVETLVGVAIGSVIRLMVLALQLAGSIAAQATSLAQIFGANATPDPMPAIGNILMLAGVTLALVGGLHVKAVIAMAGSYQLIPIGAGINGGDLATWGTAWVARAFGLAFSLAAPFVIVSFAYNVALGAINRAMPQLMVAFIGAPAITLGGIAILMLAGPLMITVWAGHLDLLLADPLAMPR